MWEQELVLTIYKRFLHCLKVCLSEAKISEPLTSDSEARTRASATTDFEVSAKMVYAFAAN